MSDRTRSKYPDPTHLGTVDVSESVHDGHFEVVAEPLAEPEVESSPSLGETQSRPFLDDLPLDFFDLFPDADAIPNNDLLPHLNSNVIYHANRALTPERENDWQPDSESPLSPQHGFAMGNTTMSSPSPMPSNLSASLSVAPAGQQHGDLLIGSDDGWPQELDPDLLTNTDRSTGVPTAGTPAPIHNTAPPSPIPLIQSGMPSQLTMPHGGLMSRDQAMDNLNSEAGRLQDVAMTAARARVQGRMGQALEVIQQLDSLEHDVQQQQAMFNQQSARLSRGSGQGQTVHEHQYMQSQQPDRPAQTTVGAPELVPPHETYGFNWRPNPHFRDLFGLDTPPHPQLAGGVPQSAHSVSFNTSGPAPHIAASSSQHGSGHESVAGRGTATPGLPAIPKNPPRSVFEYLDDQKHVGRAKDLQLKYGGLQAAMTAWEDRPSADYQLHEDATRPATQDDECAYAVLLLDAALDLESAEDTERTVDTWKGTISRRRGEVEMGVWRVLRIMVDYHTRPGFVGRRPQSGRKGDKIQSFAVHVEKVCDIFRRQKTTCRHLIGEDNLVSIVDDPYAQERRVRTNRTINAEKGKMAKQGVSLTNALKEVWERGEGLDNEALAVLAVPAFEAAEKKPSPKKRGRKKSLGTVEGGAEEEEAGDEAEGPPKKKRAHRKRTKTTEGTPAFEPEQQAPTGSKTFSVPVSSNGEGADHDPYSTLNNTNPGRYQSPYSNSTQRNTQGALEPAATNEQQEEESSRGDEGQALHGRGRGRGRERGGGGRKTRTQ